jgi:hypothetical protein
MEHTTKKSWFRRWFSLCPVRHVLTLLGLFLIGGYFLTGTAVKVWVSGHITRPLHRALGQICDLAPFSVGEVGIVLFVLGLLAYLVFALKHLKKSGKAGVYRLFLTILMLFSLIYGGFCLLWGVYYQVSSFSQDSGIERQPISTEQLEAVTNYFADLANTYGQLVERDEDGVFAEPLSPIFAASSTLYENIQEEFPCLQGPALHAKPFFFSRLMSYINFTGFFFPFTAEANINTDSPGCLVPSTIAHELAHQRGVAAEDEANFVAVLSCMAQEDPVYRYSAALLAYIHLGNALYKADNEAWTAVYSSLSEEVRADLSANNAYWDQFETPVSTVSDTVYTGFLQSYGQTEGLKTYGACVDLLVAYYGAECE